MEKSKVLKLIKNIMDIARLPYFAKMEYLHDQIGIPNRDPGPEVSIREAVEWILSAQDNSLSKDGGVAGSFSLISGWSTSYPETTGYIIPTLLAYSRRTGNDRVKARAKEMLDWLVSIQMPNGAFQGGLIGSGPVVPVTFNTGQILLGLSSGAAEFGEKYQRSMRSAAEWLVTTQDPDGCWRRHQSPFAGSGEKTYDTHVAWGLLEAARIEPNAHYDKAALANIEWALKFQHGNGWFDRCCLTDPAHPLTHTIGYAMRGIIEAYRFTVDRRFLEASIRTANGLLHPLSDDGFLPGRLDSKWSGTVPWSCLTGSLQVACCFFLLYQITSNQKYKEAAIRINNYVRKRFQVKGAQGKSGGIKGSFPVNGAYGTYAYLNWACKFFVDSNTFELSLYY